MNIYLLYVNASHPPSETSQLLLQLILLRLLIAPYLLFILWSHCSSVTFITALQSSITVKTHSPRRVDPDDTDMAEKNTLLVFLVLTRAAFLSPVGRVGELHQGALLRCGARNREGRGWKHRWKRVVRNFAVLVWIIICGIIVLLCQNGEQSLFGSCSNKEPYHLKMTYSFYHHCALFTYKFCVATKNCSLRRYP